MALPISDAQLQPEIIVKLSGQASEYRPSWFCDRSYLNQLARSVEQPGRYVKIFDLDNAFERLTPIAVLTVRARSEKQHRHIQCWFAFR